MANTTTRHFADLASNSYEQPNANQEYLNESDKQKHLYNTSDGHKYWLLANASNPKTGYQGTIYQDKISNEIIVAHRGTEPKDLNDVKADGQMASQRDNMQIADAMALTQRALSIAKKQYAANPSVNPTVNVTGHSLGGALAQVTAYKLGLNGETFNSYGAADLIGMPKNAGHGQLTNHVIATDMISSAAPHFGDVKIYARESDIIALTAAGFGKHNVLEDRTKTLATASLGSAHLMKYFTSSDSVLNDAQSLKRGERFHDTISAYRQDVYAKRDTISDVMYKSPKSDPTEQRYRGSNEFNDKGEYKNYDIKPRVMGASSFATQHPTTAENKLHQKPKAANPVDQRYHPSYEYTDKGEYKNYERKPGMFGTSSDASDVLQPTQNVAAVTRSTESPQPDPQLERMMAVMAATPAFAAMSREEQVTLAQGMMNVAQQTPAPNQIAEVAQPVQAVAAPQAPTQEAYSPPQQQETYTPQQHAASSMGTRTVAQAEPEREPPKPAVTDQPIVLTANLTSLQRQFTDKIGDQLAHLPESEQKATIALAMQEAAKFNAQKVDDVTIGANGVVFMTFDNQRTVSAEVNVSQAQNLDASQVLSATVTMQQTQQQELAQRQSQSQSGPTMNT